ncbi:hypothetical protein F511_07179 [Dorcoceras hygrometricum]|nr:hypothetical protein F511_07179 [Dorcoceras hygrometricum]
MVLCHIITLNKLLAELGEQENEGAILVSPNFNVNSQGLRRGRRPLQSPRVLKEGYEINFRLKRS